MTALQTIRIAFLDVGQGDSIVVSLLDTREVVIIDCPEADAVFDYLSTQDIRHIRGLVVTHLHLDHYRDAVNFAENCVKRLGVECERLVFNWPSNNRLIFESDRDGHDRLYSEDRMNTQQRRTVYQDLCRWSNENPEKCKPLLAGNGKVHIDGSISDVIAVLQPYHGQMGTLQRLGLNNTSAVLRVSSHGASAILTSDIEPDGWKQLQGSAQPLRSDVLKFPHHGAWQNADPEEVLASVQPSVVVISVGTDGMKYGHPNKSVLQALVRRRHIRILCTQVTSQCCADIAGQRGSIVSLFDEDARSRATPLVRTARGCPCAGTVVIDLDSTARVIQPQPAFHIDRVIRAHYPTPQCAV